jgi:hypothetical protein
MTRSVHPAVRRALATGALLALTLATAAESAACSLGRVDIYDRNEQRALETYRHDGRRYVVGTPGNEYAIRVRNCTGGRVLAVVSVDGVNVVTGETAATDQAGYVIEPGGYVNIQGWRKDLERTAAFYFSDPSDSYASRTGRPDDLGVIGVALFRERERYLPQLAGSAPAPGAPREEAASKEAAADRSRPAAASARMEPSLGTGHGRREHSPVESVEFERASRWPDERIAIRYDRRENLAAMGVLPPVRRWHDPDPFPATLGFVPDP